ncbi:type VI secretion system baseplate subunit TssK [Enterobacter sp.]|uniref:type VI secretion system baseplate subunit TssK n=1 Tax=Enterobacter sp. TaxID=42895 RepID=UPI00296E3C38|nr:type VI secretion system baseplate subunit TssK [Enterobacter sp.]
MKIYRPLWNDGAFLSPQQFQQQTRWDAHVADVVSHMAISSPWGVISAEFDDSALAVFRLNAVKLIVRFPDGTLIDTVLADKLPPACDLSSLSDYNKVDVVLALPLLSANGGNLLLEGGTNRPCRWQREWLPVQDLSGLECTDMAVLRHAITLRYAHDDNSAYLTCPVAALLRNAQGLWERDPQFFPPSLAISASPALMDSLGDLVHRIQSRCQRLMAMRRESNERMADFAVADVSLFWLLCSLNSAEPVLSDLLKNPGRHPELLWRELARLAGSLLTFSLEHTTGAIPGWQHTSPERVFPPLFALLQELLEASLPSRVISIDLIHERQFWYGALSDARLREGADLYLSVRSDMPAHLLLSQFPQLCKAGSRENVSDVINVALSGIPLKPLTHVPAAIPLRLENQYFALDLTHHAAHSMLEAGNCAFYVPGTLGDVQLELFAVLRE